MVPYTKSKETFLKLCKEVHASSEIDMRVWNSIVNLALEINEIVSVSLLEAKGKNPQINIVFVNGFEDKEFCLSKYPKEAIEKMVIEFPHRAYWNFEDLEEVYSLPAETKSVERCLDISLRVLKRQLVSFSIVCGPISTGPGTIEEKLNVFNRTIHTLSRMSLQRGALMDPIFSQMPFEDLFKKLHETIKRNDFYKGQMFLDDFYVPLFAHKKISKAYFIYRWWLSCGASQERGAFRALGIPVVNLPEDFLEKNQL